MKAAGSEMNRVSAWKSGNDLIVLVAAVNGEIRELKKEKYFEVQ